MRVVLSIIKSHPLWGHMFQGGEIALQADCVGFDSLCLHQKFSTFASGHWQSASGVDERDSHSYTSKWLCGTLAVMVPSYNGLLHQIVNLKIGFRLPLGSLVVLMKNNYLFRLLWGRSF